jgi:hypothetical protein
MNTRFELVLAPEPRRRVVHTRMARTARFADHAAKMVMEGKGRKLSRRQYRALLKMLQGLGTPAGDKAAQLLQRRRKAA